jgi:hypothetical protein
MTSNEKLRTQSKMINISASSCDQMFNDSKNSNGIWTIPNFISHDENVEHIYFSVEHAEIPNSFYLINENNNILYMLVYGIVIYYTIPVGNYNVSSLLSKLETLLPSSIGLNYDYRTSKITFNSSNYFEVKALNTTISRIMGLDKTTDMIPTYSESLAEYILECPYVVCFLPTARINFRSSLLSLENFQSNDKSSNVFLSLQNNSQQNSMILYNNQSNLKYHIDVNNLSTLDIQVTDDSNRLLDFNNVNWFLCLRVDISYYVRKQETNLLEIIKENGKLLYRNYSQNLEESDD